MGQVTTATSLAARTETSSVSVGADVEGERFEAAERLVIAPRSGVFEPVRNMGSGTAIAVGQVVGHLTTGTDRTPVVSPFAGRTRQAMAWAGERLVSHQPVLWLSVGDAP